MSPAEMVADPLSLGGEADVARVLLGLLTILVKDNGSEELLPLAVDMSRRIYVCMYPRGMRVYANEI